MITKNSNIELKNFGKYKLVTSLNAFNNLGQAVFVSTIKEKNKFKTILIDNKKNIVGINSFKIYENTFKGCNMNTLLNKNIHIGLGEIMRLTSIIELIENNLKKIQILSLSEAIPFHLKYKFKPINFGSESTNQIFFPKDKLTFDKDLLMELSVINIKNNKSFFNNLFVKHKINYRI